VGGGEGEREGGMTLRKRERSKEIEGEREMWAEERV